MLGNSVFQHDYEGPYAARVTRDFFKPTSVNLLHWPTRSPSSGGGIPKLVVSFLNDHRCELVCIAKSHW